MPNRDRERTRIFTRRTVLLAGGQFALLSTLVGRLYYLQVVQADRYAMLADENRINLRLLPPPRGRIFDRMGEPLAVNRLNYRVVLVSEQAGDVKETLNALGRIIPVSERDRARVLREIHRKRGFVPITVRENLDWSEVSRVEVNAPDLPGVMIDVGQTRDYPLGAVLGHVVGYVAPVSEKDLNGDPLLELSDFRIGKSGIEKVYDMALRGTAGNSQVEVNAYGRVIRELAREEGRPGDDLTLTIDAGLQRFVVDRLGKESASVVVLDVHTGEVMAMASNPAYDPNAFNRGLSSAEWKALVSNPRKPLTNKAVSGQYPPGSTFKMVVALAALESGVVTSDHRVFCTGSIKLGDRVFHGWKRGGHGDVDMLAAIQQSCDIYFYDIAKRVGIDRIAAMARRFGLGAPTGIDLTGERGGLVPDQNWKLGRFGVPWQQGETLVVGIGQSYLLATPLQLAVMTARIANGGKAIVPHLLRGRNTPPPKPMGLSRDSLAVVIEGMNLVTNSRRGTAYRARIAEPELAMAGKTGTAQVRRGAGPHRFVDADPDHRVRVSGADPLDGLVGATVDRAPRGPAGEGLDDGVGVVSEEAEGPLRIEQRAPVHEVLHRAEGLMRSEEHTSELQSH